MSVSAGRTIGVMFVQEINFFTLVREKIAPRASAISEARGPMKGVTGCCANLLEGKVPSAARQLVCYACRTIWTGRSCAWVVDNGGMR